MEPPSALAPASPTLDAMDRVLSGCRACPRLVAWREEVATVKRKSFADQHYWARPVPGFGPHTAAVLTVRLAPAAHRAKRPGLMFPGDRPGDPAHRAARTTPASGRRASLAI